MRSVDRVREMLWHAANELQLRSLFTQFLSTLHPCRAPPRRMSAHEHLRFKAESMVLAVAHTIASQETVQIIASIELHTRLVRAHCHPTAACGLVDSCNWMQALFIGLRS